MPDHVGVPSPDLNGDVVHRAIEEGEIRKSVNPEKYGRLFYTIIEGAVFMTSTMNDETYLQQMMSHLDDIIKNELAL